MPTTPLMSSCCSAPSRKNTFFQRGDCFAFSLIEVVIALGIVSFAFIPLFGLLPTGLKIFRGAVDQTVASQVVQQIGNETQQSDFDAVSTPAGFRYFDEQSRELPVARQSDAVYVSRMAVLQDPISPHLKRLVIQVARNPGGQVNLQESSAGVGGATLWSEANALPIVTRSLLLARSSSISN